MKFFTRFNQNFIHQQSPPISALYPSSFGKYGCCSGVNDVVTDGSGLVSSVNALYATFAEHFEKSKIFNF